jgi:hypothetical protein
MVINNIFFKSVMCLSRYVFSMHRDLIKLEQFGKIKIIRYVKINKE